MISRNDFESMRSVAQPQHPSERSVRGKVGERTSLFGQRCVARASIVQIAASRMNWSKPVGIWWLTYASHARTAFQIPCWSSIGIAGLVKRRLASLPPQLRSLAYTASRTRKTHRNPATINLIAARGHLQLVCCRRRTKWSKRWVFCLFVRPYLFIDSYTRDRNVIVLERHHLQRM
jgi:hypothetical protein